MRQIITSILDTDFYKITMGQCVFHQYPNATVKYVFKCRNKDVKLGYLAPEVANQVEMMKSLHLTQQEKNYLAEFTFMRPDYLNFLEAHRFNSSEVDAYNDNGDLSIVIRGNWASTIFWEVPLLAIVNQLYFESTTDFDEIRGDGECNLMEKIDLIKEYPRFTLTDFGTRRRYSAEWQKTVVETLKNDCPQLVGTSNIKLAMDLRIKPIGTVAHDFFSAHLGLVDNIAEAQRRALHVWLQEYDTQLGHALTDTFTTRAFFRDFRTVLANAFQGVRHDSGDPIEFGYNVINHYKNLGIDPRVKSIVFSDGLDMPKAIEIYKEFTGLIGLGFGVGTSLTNDLGVTPLNIVIKLVECNGKPVVKLSDNPSKAIGDPKMIEMVKEAYGA